MHGAEYTNLSDPQSAVHWICDYCNAVLAILKHYTTFNASRHLKNRHNIQGKRKISETENEEQVTQRKEISQ